MSGEVDEAMQKIRESERALDADLSRARIRREIATAALQGILAGIVTRSNEGETGIALHPSIFTTAVEAADRLIDQLSKPTEKKEIPK